MNNGRVVVLCGFERGGTSIAWNLLQSHPQVSSPLYEVGELLAREPRLREPDQIDTILSRYKLSTLDDPDYRYRCEGVPYTREQLAGTILCLKAINDEVFFTDTLLEVYPKLSLIALARDGHALYDSYLRRGETARAVGAMYARVAAKIEQLAASVASFTLIRFEEILADPFAVATACFRFLGVTPVELDRLRLKSKPVLQHNGERTVRFGVKGRSYWFTRDSIGQILEPAIDEIQRARLSVRLRQDFEATARPGLRYFGYALESERQG